MSEGDNKIAQFPAKAPKPPATDLYDIAPFSEEAIALTFASQYEDQLRYVADRGQWLHWNSSVWKPDAILKIFTLARKTCREAAIASDAPRTATVIATAKTVAAVERLARSDQRLVTTSEVWDTRPFLLSTPQGAVDLTTGITTPPNRNDYLTQTTTCAIAPPGTPHPTWTKFLDRITNRNAELVRFLKRYVGYSITGDITEHVFAFAWGGGQNGKGTFLAAISGLLGDFATTADVNTFIASRHERHPTDIAKLCGKRLVIAQETQKGRRWDDAKLKNATGGDVLTARFMHKDFFDFVPTFKLLIASNYKPRISSVDAAWRRRLLLIPFAVHIPEKERDRQLKEKLRAEWPAILRWAVDGCLEWQAYGLAPPAIVRDATDEYFAAEDLLGQWLDDRCDVEPSNNNKWQAVGELFASWAIYAEQANEHPGTIKTFSEALQVRGFTKCKKADGKIRAFSGIRPAAAAPSLALALTMGKANDINGVFDDLNLSCKRTPG